MLRRICPVIEEIAKNIFLPSLKIFWVLSFQVPILFAALLNNAFVSVFVFTTYRMSSWDNKRRTDRKIVSESRLSLNFDIL